MSFKFLIATGTGKPIYRQLTEQVRLAVATGRLEVGSPLPSIRALAEQLVVNPNTVARAYNELVQEGVLESPPGKGAFVAQKRTILTRAERVRRLSPSLQALVNQGLTLGFELEEIREAFNKEIQEQKKRKHP